jgi:hypothetical protein
VAARPLRARTLILLDDGAAFDAPELDHEFWECCGALAPPPRAARWASSSPRMARFGHADARARPDLAVLQHLRSHAGARPVRARRGAELIAGAPAPFAADDVEWILAHGAGWPAILQKLCDLRWNALKMATTATAGASPRRQL